MERGALARQRWPPDRFPRHAAGGQKWPHRSADLYRTQARPQPCAASGRHRKPEKAAAEARRKARRDAQREGYQVSKETLEAADWVILLTSLPPDDFSTEDVLDLYRLRWRI